MDLYFDFSSVLGIATAIAGVLWGVDACFFRKKRIEQTQALIDEYKLSGVDAKKVKPDDLDDLIAQQTDMILVERAPRMAKWADYAKGFFPVLLLVFGLRAFITEPFRIPSGSMRPTLLEGDFILVNKFAYGVRLPLTGTKLFGNGQPQRGDILVFRNPEDTSINFIKRIAGLPGDRIQVKDKVVYINGQKINQEYIETSLDTDITGIQRKVKHFKEKLNSTEHSIYVSPYGDSDYPETLVPDNHYFVLGDNRDFSRDSREWGFVPEKLILGKAYYIWLSLDTTKKDVRWDRFGKIESKEDKS